MYVHHCQLCHSLQCHCQLCYYQLCHCCMSLPALNMSLLIILLPSSHCQLYHSQQCHCQLSHCQLYVMQCHANEVIANFVNDKYVIANYVTANYVIANNVTGNYYCIIHVITNNATAFFVRELCKIMVSFFFFFFFLQIFEFLCSFEAILLATLPLLCIFIKLRKVYILVSWLR